MLAAVAPVFCVFLGVAFAADKGARQADPEQELSRRLQDSRECCMKKPPDFGSSRRREPAALDKDPEGWRMQGPERYPDAIGVEHCQIQRGQLLQMVVELRAATRRRDGARTGEQAERDAWQPKTGGGGSSR